jgi:hypothetical protein
MVLPGFTLGLTKYNLQTLWRHIVYTTDDQSLPISAVHESSTIVSLSQDLDRKFYGKLASREPPSHAVLPENLDSQHNIPDKKDQI